MENKLVHEQKQIQKLSQSMRQSLDVLQMSTKDLYAWVSRECVKNPTIEMQDVARKVCFKNDSDDHQAMMENIAERRSLQDHLLSQVPDWTQERKDSLLLLLSCLNDRGFLDRDMVDVSKILNMSLDDAMLLRNDLMHLDPCGIGAMSLKECLCVQLCDMDDGGDEIALAKKILEKYFDVLQSGNIDVLVSKLGVSRDDILQSGRRIMRMRFSPISGFVNDAIVVAADIRICKRDGEWEIIFNDDSLPNIRYTQLYREAAVHGNGYTSADWKYIKQQANNGRKLGESLVKRRETLLEISKIILDRQIDFFEHGKTFLHSLRLKDVAKVLGLNISTICRAVQNKYVNTPHGTYPMSYFFDYGNDNMGTFSQSAIMQRIRDIIDGKGDRLSDRGISEALKCDGIIISRRTVAKYRQSMGVPSLRRRIK